MSAAAEQRGRGEARIENERLVERGDRAIVGFHPPGITLAQPSFLLAPFRKRIERPQRCSQVAAVHDLEGSSHSSPRCCAEQ